MFQKIKTYVIIAAVSIGMGAPALVPAFAGTASASIQTELCNGVGAADGNASCGTQGSGDAAGGVKLLATKIINIFSVVIGAVAVIMILFGGFRYITSGGDSGRVGTAKNTLIYAIIGLIIVAVAQIIVRYVINTAGDSAAKLT